MEIINLNNKDYHMHSLNFSDWMNTVDELVQFAWSIWLKEIAITDHSDAATEKSSSNPPSWRWHIERWKNIFNDVSVIFWVEWDLLDEDWSVCFDIQGREPEFIILSVHKKVYKWKLDNLNLAYENAIKKYHKKIKFIWHPCLKKTSEHLDIKRLCMFANKYNVPLEINWTWLKGWIMDPDKHKDMLKYWDKFYINSDAHNLYELKESRKFAINFLKKEWYINKK